jgi:hypothetical protein
MHKTTHIVAFRLPKNTYKALMQRSQDWNMSISSLIREVVIKIFSEDNEFQTIKNYKPRKEK